MALRRKLKVTYGSYVAGYGQNKRHATGPVRFGPASIDRVSVGFTIALTADDAADLATEVTAFRAAFGVENLQLLIEYVSESAGTSEGTLVNLQPASGSRTAGNVVPSFGPGGPAGDSYQSHVFDVTVEADLLASYDSNYARQDVRYEITEDASRIRELRISGTFTATASATAYATYQTGVTALRSAIVTILGGTWPTVPRMERAIPDKENHLCPFVVEYRERVVNESTSTLDDADITDPQLVVDVGEVAGDRGSKGDTPLRPVIARGRYAIDADRTTDLVDMWESTVLPHIRNTMEDLAGGTVYVLEAHPGYDYEHNTLNPSVSGVARGDGPQLFRRIRVADTVDYGWIFRDVVVPAAASTTSEQAPTPAYAYPGPRVVMRLIEVVSRRIGREVPGDLGNLIVKPAAEVEALKKAYRNPAAGGVFRIRWAASYQPRILGLPSDDALDVTDRTDTLVLRVVAPVPATVATARARA